MIAFGPTDILSLPSLSSTNLPLLKHHSTFQYQIDHADSLNKLLSRHSSYDNLSENFPQANLLKESETFLPDSDGKTKSLYHQFAPNETNRHLPNELSCSHDFSTGETKPEVLLELKASVCRKLLLCVTSKSLIILGCNHELAWVPGKH